MRKQTESLCVSGILPIKATRNGRIERCRWHLRRPNFSWPPIFYAAMRGFSLAKSTCRGIKFDLALVSVWACKKCRWHPVFLFHAATFFPSQKAYLVRGKAAGFNRTAFNVFLSKTCHKVAHIEQSERSGTLHIEWAQAHISSGHRPHIDINTSQERSINYSISPEWARCPVPPAPGDAAPTGHSRRSRAAETVSGRLGSTMACERPPSGPEPKTVSLLPRRATIWRPSGEM